MADDHPPRHTVSVTCPRCGSKTLVRTKPLEGTHQDVLPDTWVCGTCGEVNRKSHFDRWAERPGD